MSHFTTTKKFYNLNLVYSIRNGFNLFFCIFSSDCMYSNFYFNFILRFYPKVNNKYKNNAGL